MSTPIFEGIFKGKICKITGADPGLSPNRIGQEVCITLEVPTSWLGGRIFVKPVESIDKNGVPVLKPDGFAISPTCLS